MENSRNLIVNKVIIHPSETITLGFKDCIVSFDIPKVNEFYNNVIGVKEGDEVTIVGRFGNEDVMLASPNPLKHISYKANK